jgi:hypothetical protein
MIARIFSERTRDLRTLNNHFGTLGHLIIGIFIVSSLAPVAVYRAKGYEDELTA